MDIMILAFWFMIVVEETFDAQKLPIFESGRGDMHFPLYYTGTYSKHRPVCPITATCKNMESGLVKHSGSSGFSIT